MRKRTAMMAIGICTAAGASIIVAQDEIQNLTARFISEVDHALVAKEAELLEI